jgi:hypothetical protein
MFGKKNFNDYSCVKRDFFGHFPNVFTIDKEQYLNKKLEYLARDRTKEDKDYKFNIALACLCNHISANQAEKELRAMGLKISNDTIMRHSNKISKEITNTHLLI